MNIAIQGQAGSFHEQAAAQWFKNNYDIIPCATFSDVFTAYETGEADAIVCAVENTIYGSINEVYQLIEDCSAPLVGEVKLQINHQLIARSDATPKTITEIYSHPVALAQCREYLTAQYPNAELIEYFDTAGAVEFVKSLNANTAAAVAGEQAARLYGLPIIAKNIQDNMHNHTRFLVLQDNDTSPQANRAALVITTADKPGALAEVLNIFATNSVNLEKLQSQPIIGQPWEYKFYLVVDTTGSKLRKIVSQIEKSDHAVTLLGEYVGA